MKRFFASIILIFAALAFPLAASAHVLQTDGSIGAVMHIDPEDDPIVGRPATFFFELKDRQNRFKPEECDCTAAVIRDGQSLFSAKLFRDNANNAIDNPTFSYTFSAKAVYTIRLTGSPISSGDFQPFSLSYDLRVDREPVAAAASPSSSSTTHTIHYILFGGGFVTVLFFYLRDKYKSGRGKRDGKTQKSVRTGLLALTFLFALTLHQTSLAQAICGHQNSAGAVEHQCCVPHAAAIAVALTLGLFAILSGAVNLVYLSANYTTYNLINNKSPPALALL